MTAEAKIGMDDDFGIEITRLPRSKNTPSSPSK
jgi:hypothetical protein